MSARSTPQSAYMDRKHSSTSSLRSPASTSTEIPTWLRKRQSSSNSHIFAMPTVPEAYRRGSGLGSRKASQTSLSGTSTPYARRRARQEPIAEDDWAALEPDEVFKRLPVGEVKRVEAKMRADALNKQSELRSMVGTRYRDLLTSATQITSLRNSSLNLSKSLKGVSASCRSSAGLNIVTDETAPDEAEDVINMLPVAAHMKLLLDAPEALYSYLSRHAFLKAAFLWLITRVVREGLVSMPEDVNEPYLPLLQKQWEILLPFRAQIVQRATVALRSRDEVDSKVLSETLLAIILLDNLSIPDALALFLNQRTKTLRDILKRTTSDASTSQNHLSLTRVRSRRNSRASITHKEREDIGAVLAESVKSVLETVALVRTVFEKQRKGSVTESLLEQMQRSVQAGEPVPSAQPLAPRRTSHERRASRLASISLALPKYGSSSTAPPVSSAQVMQELPSSQILLRHLPGSITGFTPFIAPSAAPNLDDKLASWQQSTTQILSEAIPGWLAALTSVADVWQVRAELIKLLNQGALEASIREALESQWGQRIQAIWGTKLDDLVNLTEESVRDAAEAIRRGGDEVDTNPEAFIFSDLTFPPPPTSALTASSAPFNTFINTVSKRTSLRTPALDAVLLTLESYASTLRADTLGLPTSLYASYGQKLDTTLKSLVGTLDKVLSSLGPERGDDKDGIDAELFVGRIAIHLARKSSFLDDLAGDRADSLDDTRTALTRSHAASVARWTEKVVKDATKQLLSVAESDLQSDDVAATWQGLYPIAPSDQLMVSLHSLVSATRHLGIPPGVDLPVVKDLLEAFVASVKDHDGWTQIEDAAAAQIAMDLAFLSHLVGEQPERDVSVQKALQKIPSSVPSEFKEKLPQLALDHLRRSQLLLRPLIRHLDTSAVAMPPRSVDSRNKLLRLGAPISHSSVGSDFRSPLAVAKPNKRFGLLSIAA